MKSTGSAGYNERLFRGGLRGNLHLVRFRWLHDSLKRLDCVPASVLELGCFDGRSIHFLPAPPQVYYGFDANWEGGLDLAVRQWAQHPNYHFVKCQTPDEMSLEADQVFDATIALETLEHIPPHLLDGYLAKIAQHTRRYLFVSVPNEKGLVFLLKWLVKRLFSRDAQQYTFSEIVNATLGRMHQVARREHKGFDHAALLRQIGASFDVIRVQGIPFAWLPLSLSFSIGVIARRKGNE